MRNYVTLFDPFFDLFFHEPSNKYNYMMDTDIIDKKDHYLMKVNMPNVKKEDLNISLKNGYLTIHVEVKNDNKEEEYLLRERNYESYERSYYVGEDIKYEDIKAKLENGLLELTIQKENPEKKTHYIDIQ